MAIKDIVGDKWRNRLLHKCYIVCWIIFFTELIIFFFDKGTGILFLPVPLFLMRFMIIPSAINFLSVYIGYKILNESNYNDIKKNNAVCFVFSTICICVECTHYVFGPILCAPCIAIFVSVVIGNVKITRIITLTSFVSLVFTTWIASMELRAGDKMLMLDATVAFVITLCSYMVSTLLIQLEKTKADEMMKSYLNQIEMSKQLMLDPLTGLYNRRALFEMLEKEVMKADNDSELYLAILDIDDFKNINDNYGHSQGDNVLIYLAGLFKKHTAHYGYTSRFGGEEFAIIFPNTQKEGALNAIEQICNEFSNHEFEFINSDKKVNVTISCGLKKYNVDQTVKEFFHSCDEVMYMAKKAGKNRVIIAEHIQTD